MTGRVWKNPLVDASDTACRVGSKVLFFLLTAAAALQPAARGDVVINELVAAGSDRLLQRTATGYPRLGLTPQWYQADYDDSLWSQGSGPFGFGSFAGNTFGVNTSALMQNKRPALYLRKAFTASVAQATSPQELQFTIRYNDGFIAFLNGSEIARRNMGTSAMYAYRDQTAFSTNSGSAAETISLGLASNRLVSGANLLCIQTHNRATTGTYSDTLLCRADLRIGGAAPVSLVTNTAVWRYFAGGLEPSGGVIDYGLLSGVPLTATWATLGFNDAWWETSNGPFGIENAVPPDYVLGTNLFSQVINRAASIYSRTLFSATAAEASSTNRLQLSIDYDDGVIVYVNGREAVRRNLGTASTVTPYNTLATASHSASGDGGGAVGDVSETVLLGPASTLLAPGYNVIAVQLHNNALGSSDLIARFTLSTTGASARTLARAEDAGRFFVGTSEPYIEDAETDTDAEEDTPDSEGDWIELHNTGDEAVSLTGWSLTDDEDEPRKWYFPAGSAIPAGGYLLVMATGFDVGPGDGATYPHTNFKLSSEGEYLGLVDAAGNVVSEIAPGYPAQNAFHSYARTLFGTYVYRSQATPGAANAAGSAFSAQTQPPAFSHLGGFYAASFPLQLTAPDAAATIRYTTDGTEPTEANGATYSLPLTISAPTTLRVRCFKTGEVPSPTVNHTYLVAQSAARRSIPAISVVGDPVFTIYGPNAVTSPTNGQGIMAIKGGGYTNAMWENFGDTSAFNVPMLRGRSSEKPVSFEYYPTNGNPLRTELGLRISGSNHARPRYKLTTAPALRFTPTDFTQKPSFNIFFRNELGESPQDYTFFPDSKVTKFEDMRLRAGKNDIANPFIRDEFARRVYLGTGQEGSLGNIVSLYINGIWKGYYNFCEHLRQAFMQQHHNSTAAWDVQQVNEFASGDSIHWNRTIAYLRTNALTEVNAYLGVADYLDVDNYIDYIVVNSYAGMWDWPNNNWVAAHERSDAGRWRFYMWDAEGCFGGTGRTNDYNTFTSDLIIPDAKTTTSRYIPAIYTLLRVSPEFRLRFADRAQKHLFHGGCLTRESLDRTFFTLCDTVNPIMKETGNGTVNATFYTNWIYKIDRRTNYFNQLVAQNIWPATLAPEFTPHGGTIDTNTWVSITNLNSTGSLYFTTNGVDPRAPGGAVAGEAYTAPLRFPATATLKARVLSGGGEWSPLQEAAFSIPLQRPLFMPAVSADWTVNANWSTAPAPYPNGVGASAQINAPPSANRDVNLRAPVTVGTLLFNQGDSPYRTKISDSGSTNTLTFQTTNANARVTVNGSGCGYVEFEVDADVILATNLTLEVNNPTGNVSYGALRLKTNWRGPGGLVKEGVGLVALTGESKSYTGPTVINQGVLQFTQPAAPLQSASVTVNPGGQLRLTSASTAGEPRIYTFGGDLILDSAGRGGPLPDAGGLGISGALRYAPESNDSYALITNRVILRGPSAIHVEDARNTLELTSPLSGTYSFTKTGGGNLVLPAFSTGYYLPVTVSNGTLTVRGRLVSPVRIAAGGTLTGCGVTGPLQGDGTVALDGVRLTASAAIGLNYAFSFGATAPAYASPTESGNAVLRLLSIQRGAAASLVDLYLDLPSLAAGDRLRGGFFVECGNDLAGFLAHAVVRFFVPSESGTQSFAGRLYAPYTGTLPLTVAAMPETADFGDGPRRGHVLEIRVAGPPVRYSEWVLNTFSVPESESDPALTGPLAMPYGSGDAVNLLRYAFDVASDEPACGKLPQFQLVNGTPTYSFRFDPGKSDLAYIVEASRSATGAWSRVLFDSRWTDPPAWNWDGTTLVLPDAAGGPALLPEQFYRLRIQLTEP